MNLLIKSDFTIFADSSEYTPWVIMKMALFYYGKDSGGNSMTSIWISYNLTCLYFIGSIIAYL